MNLISHWTYTSVLVGGGGHYKESVVVMLTFRKLVFIITGAAAGLGGSHLVPLYDLDMSIEYYCFTYVFGGRGGTKDKIKACFSHLMQGKVPHITHCLVSQPVLNDSY